MRRLLVTLMVAFAVSFPSTAVSQTAPEGPQEAAPPAEPQAASAEGVTFGALFSDLGRELPRLVSKQTAITLGLGGAFALAAHPADREISERATRSVSLDRILEAGEVAGGGYTQGGLALATFLIGRGTGNRRVQAVGADLVQAQILAGVVTHALKFSAGRSRPDAGRFSFPSGHSSSSFANATVLHRHFGWKVGLPAYGFATYVAASRLQENRHYASDVIFGAAIGLVAGRTVTVGRGRATFEVAPVAMSGGAGVMFTRIR